MNYASPKIKICVITNLDDAISIAKLKPDYLGFIINVPESPRNMSPPEVKKIVANVRKINKKIMCVGVFVNQPIAYVLKTMKYCNLDIAQLHGNESDAEVKKIKTKYEVWKAFTISSTADKILLDFKGERRPIVLAGGLGVPDVLDANSKLETSPGKKNIKLVETFIHATILQN